MTMMEEHDIDEPQLPRELLPDALPRADAAAWVLERERIMTQLESPALQAPLLGGSAITRPSLHR